jgi:hypothetical protein
MNYLSKLLIAAFLAAAGMVFAYLWLSEWIAPLGLLTGYLDVIVIEKWVPSKSLLKDVLLFSIFACFVFFSSMLLWILCYFIPNIVQCGALDKEVFVVSLILYPLLPISALYVFVWVPRHLRNWLRR